MMKPATKGKAKVAPKTKPSLRDPGPVAEVHYVAYRPDNGAVTTMHTVWAEEGADSADDEAFVAKLASDGKVKRSVSVLRTATLPDGPVKVDPKKGMIVAKRSKKGKALAPVPQSL